MPCAPIRLGLSNPRRCRRFERAHAEALHAVVDFRARLMQMQMDRQIALLGEGQHLGEVAVIDRVGGMRGEAKTE